MLNSNDYNKLITFLQDIRPFEAVGGAGFLELVQHTMDSRQETSRHYTMFIYYYYFFNKTIRMYYSLFVFRFYYKIISLSFKNLAGSGLTCLWPAGMG